MLISGFQILFCIIKFNLLTSMFRRKFAHLFFQYFTYNASLAPSSPLLAIHGMRPSKKLYSNYFSGNVVYILLQYTEYSI